MKKEHRARQRAAPDTMDHHAYYLHRALDLIESSRGKLRPRVLARDRLLQRLITDLVAARTAVAMTQQDVALRMCTTRSVVSRLESGIGTRPTLRTIERYAWAVNARVEIHIRPWRPR